MMIKLLIGRGTYGEMAASLRLFSESTDDIVLAGQVQPVFCSLHKLSDTIAAFTLNITCPVEIAERVVKIAMKSLPDTAKNDLSPSALPNL